jgi:hypothetical protein
MKLGFFLRKLSITIIGFVRHLRETKQYFEDYIFENSLKRGNLRASKILHFETVYRNSFQSQIGESSRILLLYF